MIQDIKARVQALDTERSYLKREITYLREKIKNESRSLSLIEKAQTILKNTAIQTQNQLSFELSSIASLALDSVFPEPYEFDVRFVEKRNRTEIEFELIKKKTSLSDPLESVGGGVCDIVSFSLRISCILISGKEKILLLDEPFKNLSRNLHPVAGTLLKKLEQELQIQFLIISHDKSIIEMLDADIYTL